MSKLYCSMFQVNVDCSDEERKEKCSMCLEQSKDNQGNCVHLEEIIETQKELTQEVKAKIPPGSIIKKIDVTWDYNVITLNIYYQ